LSLLGSDGLLKQPTKSMIDAALGRGLTRHLGDVKEKCRPIEMEVGGPLRFSH
jgi:hypothetical protein